jgi:DNA-binding response OmpR family regulator
MMNNGLLLWVDDEIELLKAHILFLEKKGYEVETVSNGQDALDKCSETTYDLILLDENMPGLSGLETLSRIKEITPVTPVVMVTKSEYHGPGHRFQNCRLSHQARQPHANPPDPEKEHP